MTEAEHKAEEERARVARVRGGGSKQRGMTAFFERSRTYVQDTTVPVAPAPPPQPLSAAELSAVRIRRWQTLFLSLKAKKLAIGRPPLPRALVRGHFPAH